MKKLLLPVAAGAVRRSPVPSHCRVMELTAGFHRIEAEVARNNAARIRA